MISGCQAVDLSASPCVVVETSRGGNSIRLLPEIYFKILQGTD